MRLRFAPSPTGYLHVGNARTALFNYYLAKKQDGKFILRIEDTDKERSKKKYEEQLINDLKWLGIQWDEGPDVGGEYGPYRQSERLEIYKEHALKLIDEGKAYYCFCTPEELEEERKKAIKEKRPPIYSGKCRNIPIEEAKKRVRSGEKASIRFRMPDTGIFKYKDIVRGELSFDMSLFGDFIIVRSNGLPSYNFAVVIDDHYMGITHVIRGEDHISNTPKQIMIYRAFGWKEPDFAHLSMVLGPDGSPLSKRHGATSITQFKEMGYLPEALVNYLSLLGWAPPEGREILSIDEIIELFSIEKVSKSGAIFDYEKLNWVNRKHISELKEKELFDRAKEFLKEYYKKQKFNEDEILWFSLAISSIRTGIIRLTDIPELLKVYFEFQLEDSAKKEFFEEEGEKLLSIILDYLKDKKELRKKDIYSLIKICKEKGIKGKKFFHPLRIILTGKTSGVELEKFIDVIEESYEKTIEPEPLKFDKRIKIFKELIGG